MGLLIFRAILPICGAFRDLVPRARFKIREKLKLTLLHGCFSRFLYCTNGAKSRDASHMFQKLGGRVCLSSSKEFI